MLPEVSTKTATIITMNSATLNGFLDYTADTTTEYGFILVNRDMSISIGSTSKSKSFTYIWDGLLPNTTYISPIMDCCTGEILTLETRNDMKKELCIDTVKSLCLRYNLADSVILHSDCGSQYASDAFRDELRKYSITQSLSGTGHCFDNARMESFFATLKKEKLYRIPTYRMTREEVRTVIFRYIFTYYNTVRIYTRIRSDYLR